MTDTPRHRTPLSTAPLRLVRDATDALSYAELVERAHQTELQGRRADARELYEVALCRLPDARTGVEASDVLRWIAGSHRADGNLDLAVECAEAALAVAEAHGHRTAMVHANDLLTILRQFQGSRITGDMPVVPSPGAPQRDELTGLPLRRAFEQATRRALAERKEGEAVSLLVVDVDHFKLVNDTYGHLQGDMALRGVARVLSDVAPPTAFVGRFAGDEFVVLLPDTPIDAAIAIAEALRVAAHGVPVAQGRVIPVALTLSVGVASATTPDATLESLFAAADAALYDAKHHGRDAVSREGASHLTVQRPNLEAFIARDDERRRLGELLARAAAGAPQVVSIVGEAGVGKTSLVRSLASEVRVMGGSLVTGRSADADIRVPLWPWASVISAIRALRAVPDRSWQALSRLMPAAGGPANAAVGHERFTLFDEVTEFLREASASRPFVVLLDDMQWADRASWDLLEHVIARLDHERLMLCITVRDEDATREVLRRRARLSRDARFHELRVTPLEQGDLARWLRQAFQQELSVELLGHIHRLSEGNPFFVVRLIEELLDRGDLVVSDGRWQWRGGDEVVMPTAVADLLGRRLARLTPEASRILAAAAVIGRSIDIDVIVAAGIATEDAVLDAIDEGVAARILATSHGADERAVFTHGLLVELLQRTMNPRRLRRVREQVARVLVPWRPPQGGSHATPGDSAAALRRAE